MPSVITIPLIVNEDTWFICKKTVDQRIPDIKPPIILFVDIINFPLISILLKLRTKISLVRIISNGNSGYCSIIKNITDMQLRYLSLNKSSSLPPVVVSLNLLAK